MEQKGRVMIRERPSGHVRGPAPDVVQVPLPLNFSIFYRNIWRSKVTVTHREWNGEERGMTWNVVLSKGVVRNTPYFSRRFFLAIFFSQGIDRKKKKKTSSSPAKKFCPFLLNRRTHITFHSLPPFYFPSLSSTVLGKNSTVTWWIWVAVSFSLSLSSISPFLLNIKPVAKSHKDQQELSHRWFSFCSKCCVI